MFASNGLIYEVSGCGTSTCRSDWLAAKGMMSADWQQSTRKEKVNYLKRHAIVCGHFRGHPQIPINLAPLVEEGEDCWWVIDEWIPGPTLAEILAAGPVDPSKLPRVMREIALGLEALHGQGIIRRELSPRFVILRDRMRRWC